MGLQSDLNENDKEKKSDGAPRKYSNKLKFVQTFDVTGLQNRLSSAEIPNLITLLSASLLPKFRPSHLLIYTYSASIK